MQNLLIHSLSLLAQVECSYSYSSQGKAPGPVFWICWFAFVILMIAALWKVFAKAGQPGWAAIIPIVNTYFLCKVAGRPRLVGNPDAHSFCEFHHLDHPLHRCGKELRKRCGFWNWFAFAAICFLSDPRLRQRSVSRPFGGPRGSCYSAAAACLGFWLPRSHDLFAFAQYRSTAILAVWQAGVSPAKYQLYATTRQDAWSPHRLEACAPTA
jgi:hypothetical protein